MKITTVGVCIICGIFPLLILPQLPGTLTLAFLTLFACVLAFIPVKTVRYIALTLLFEPPRKSWRLNSLRKR